MGCVIAGKVLTIAGLVFALIGTALVGFMTFRVTSSFTGHARIYHPDPTSRMVGETEPANPRRWRWGWGLILVGVLLQLAGAFVG